MARPTATSSVATARRPASRASSHASGASVSIAAGCAAAAWSRDIPTSGAMPSITVRSIASMGTTATIT